jgi:hypothetical protein
MDVDAEYICETVGKNSTFLQVPFLNLMANLQQRAGSIMVRVGGNTQESAKLVPDGTIPDGRVLIKNLTGVTGTTQTPPLDFSRDLLYMMRNISSLVNVHWFLGIPWFITQPFDLAIVTASQEILGDYLLGLQAGNEPDMYSIPSHGHRNDTYGPADYLGEFADLLTQVQATNADPSGQAMTKLIAPNVANFAWKTEDVVAAGLVDKFGPNLAFMAVEKCVVPLPPCAFSFSPLIYLRSADTPATTAPRPLAAPVPSSPTPKPSSRSTSRTTRTRRCCRTI